VAHSVSKTDTNTQSGLFAGMSGDEQATLLARGRRRTLDAGEVLFSQGDPALYCYYVVENRLKLSLVHEEGKEAIVRFINPGEITAAAAVFRGKTYPATAVAVGTVAVVAWDRSTMLEMMRICPGLAINLLQVVVDRLDEIQNRYLQLSAEQVDQRIARAVLRIMQQSGRKTDDGIEIDFKISRQELADYTGTTLYTVSRVLSAWEKKGWVALGRERIAVTDPHALVGYAEKI
jgi:CRP-like cAMP-binding protein